MTEKYSRRRFLDLSWKLAALAGLSYGLNPDNAQRERSAAPAGLCLNEIKLGPEGSIRFDSAVKLAEDVEQHYRRLGTLRSVNLPVDQQVSGWSNYWQEFFGMKNWPLPPDLMIVCRYDQPALSGTTHLCQPPVILNFPCRSNSQATIELLPGLLAHEFSHLLQNKLCLSNHGGDVEGDAELMTWAALAQAIVLRPKPLVRGWLERALWKSLFLRAREVVGLSWIREGRPDSHLIEWADRSGLAEESWCQRFLSLRDKIEGFSAEAQGTEFAGFTKRWKVGALNESDAAVYAERPWFTLINCWQRGQSAAAAITPSGVIDLADLFKLLI